MKKTNPPDSKANRFIAFLTYCIISQLLPFINYAQTGASCSTAIVVQSDSLPYADGLLMSQVKWYFFIPKSSDTKIMKTNFSPLIGDVTSLESFFGSCSSLDSFSGSVFITSPQDSLVMQVSGMNKGEQYFI